MKINFVYISVPLLLVVNNIRRKMSYSENLEITSGKFCYFHITKTCPQSKMFKILAIYKT